MKNPARGSDNCAETCNINMEYCREVAVSGSLAVIIFFVFVIIYFENFPYFHAKLGLDVCPKLNHKSTSSGLPASA